MRGLAILLGVLLAVQVAAEEAALPAGVSPLPEKLSSRVGELLDEAEKYRGLEAKAPVPSGIVDDPALQRKLIESFETDLPPEKLRPVEVALKAFGLVPESLDLVKFLPELLTTQVAGYYDPERHYLALVQRDGKILPTELSGDAARRAEEAVLVHELTHALQDQHFHLETFATGQPLDDADAAKVALIEGDATLVMMDFFAQTRLAAMPGIEETLGTFLDDPGALLETAPGVPGAADLASSPRWFQDTLLFSYFEGFQFCLNVRRTGGQALLDHAFKTDPPRSSEQILHPEKWHAKRDDPIVIRLPDLSSALPGWSEATEAQLGELSIRTLLRPSMKKDERAVQAAAGWGGDRFAVYQKADARLLVWVTEWDTEADAREFQSAANKLGRSWDIRRMGSRVVVTRGELTKAERSALQAELAATAVERPANRSIDLAILGIKPGAGSLEELMKHPQVQELMTSASSQELPAGEITDDGRTYSNSALGFSIGVPRSQNGWVLSTDAAEEPAVVVMLISPNREANVVVLHMPVGQAIDIATMGPMIEMGMRMPLADYKQIGAGVIERNGSTAYEVEFEAVVQGDLVRALARFYTQGTNVLMAAAYITPPNRWRKNERAAREILDSFALREPVRQEPPLP